MRVAEFRGKCRGGLAALLAAALLSSCADLTPTQQRAMTGTAGGAAGGALIGAMAGNAGLGAAAGAGAGLVGGLLYDYHKRSEQKAYEQGKAAGQQSAVPPSQ